MSNVSHEKPKSKIETTEGEFFSQLVGFHSSANVHEIKEYSSRSSYVVKLMEEQFI